MARKTKTVRRDANKSIALIAEALKNPSSHRKTLSHIMTQTNQLLWSQRRSTAHRHTGRSRYSTCWTTSWFVWGYTIRAPTIFCQREAHSIGLLDWLNSCLEPTQIISHTDSHSPTNEQVRCHPSCVSRLNPQCAWAGQHWRSCRKGIMYLSPTPHTFIWIW